MSLVAERYARLAPRVEYLGDPTVLALAWKKASTYTRRHNWYADTLELDASSLNLQKLTETWAAEVSQGVYRPAVARLVPAPKNGRWVFDSAMPGGWGPAPSQSEDVAKRDVVTLRPLAHLGIREQTVATAVLLCLADCIETAQGDTAVSAMEALGRRVFSYGNRLFCKWDRDRRQARFSWGSSDTYSRYYADYQKFVARPREVAALLDDTLGTAANRIYLVKLDISAYYDHIQIPRLVEKLRREYSAYSDAYESHPADDEEFWTRAEAAFTIGWSDDDQAAAILLKGGKLPGGLPQGLMASGFLANAYLLDFDRAVGNACIRKRTIRVDRYKVTLHDYCRYVDDLRLVISTKDPDLDVSRLETALTSWVQEQLDESLGDGGGDSTLTLNSAKTEVELLSKVAKATSVASRMKQVQQQLSGPFDLSSLEELETSLNGLLSMAELDGSGSRRSGGHHIPSLALVTKPPMDVRDDTLTRFAAFRLCKSLKQRRLLTDLLEAGDGGTAGDQLRQDYEMAARRLVGAWSENPSLVQVLRYAFDLYPGHLLLRDVLNALNGKLHLDGAHQGESAVAWYILAELYRAAATETGKSTNTDDDLFAGDADEYREELAQHAESLLQAGGVPWYVQQQAALLLASLGFSTSSLGDDHELARYRALHSYMAGRLSVEGLSDDELVSTAIVGQQLTGRPRGFKLWLNRFEEARGRNAAKQALELVFKGSPSLFNSITTQTSGKSEFDDELLSKEQKLHIEARGARALKLSTSGWVPLSKVICHTARPLRHENSLLRLASCLAEIRRWTRDDGSIFSVYDFQVRCEDWGQLDDPDGAALKLRLAPGAETRRAPRFRAPAWCSNEMTWLYAIGMILRASAVGSNDFTMSWKVGIVEPGWYRGVSSTPSRRQLGMMHTSQALGGTSSSVTPWFSGMLAALLRWPGIEDSEDFHEAAGVRRLKDLRAIVAARLATQRALYGKSSKSPVYRYPVPWQLRSDRKLRVAVVQGLLPSYKDFTLHKLDGLDSKPFRTRHRHHTAALLSLVSKKLDAYDHLGGRPGGPTVDLVVLPEYSIHVLDQDLLRAFSDKTGAMLHYGLLCALHPTSSDFTNAARWLIPVRTKKRRSWIEVDQGKLHLTEDEKELGVEKWCPYRIVIELQFDKDTRYRMVGAICYDATDLALAADMKNESHMFVIPAFNKDTKTFDSMIAALRYHLYQHVVICNTGEFGGSSAQAPYDDEHRRTISHAHGATQISVSVFDVDLDDFGPRLRALEPAVSKTIAKRVGKTPPAGLNRRR